MYRIKDYSLSCIQLFVTPWTVPARFLCPWDSPGKNTGVGCHFLLQGIFPAQEDIYLYSVVAVSDLITVNLLPISTFYKTMSKTRNL